MPGFGFVLMLLAPPILGLVFGLLQLLAYVVLVKTGRMPAEKIPFFPILWLRGMLLVVVLGVILAMLQHTDGLWDGSDDRGRRPPAAPAGG